MAPTRKRLPPPQTSRRLGHDPRTSLPTPTKNSPPSAHHPTRRTTPVITNTRGNAPLSPTYFRPCYLTRLQLRAMPSQLALAQRHVMPPRENRSEAPETGPGTLAMSLRIPMRQISLGLTTPLPQCNQQCGMLPIQLRQPSMYQQTNRHPRPHSPITTPRQLSLRHLRLRTLQYDPTG
jgi:hypothetical protein